MLYPSIAVSLRQPASTTGKLLLHQQLIRLLIKPVQPKCLDIKLHGKLNGRLTSKTFVTTILSACLSTSITPFCIWYVALYSWLAPSGVSLALNGALYHVTTSQPTRRPHLLVPPQARSPPRALSDPLLATGTSPGVSGQAKVAVLKVMSTYP